MGELGVGRDAVDVAAEGLQRVLLLGDVGQFGRADEGEVGRIEEDD
jgi:hypothetical protein